MQIAIFGTPDDRPYLKRLQELLGPVGCKVSLNPEEYLMGVVAKARAAKFDAIIVTCPTTMTTLLKALPDFRHPVDKRGNQRNLATSDYAGSFFDIPKAITSLDHDIPVLVLSPLAQLVTTAEGPFVFKRFVSKLVKPQAWFPQTRFTWEVWTHATSDALLERFGQAKILSVDIETYVGDEHRRIDCVGYCALFSDGSTHTVVVPFDDRIAHSFVKKLNASAPPKVMQGGLYDNLYFFRWDVPVHNWIYDTQHLFHAWYSELPKRLDFITAFAVRKIRYWKDDAAGSRHNKFEYNARDCWGTLMSWCALSVEVPQWGWDNYLKEFPLVFPCLHMEADGLSIDEARFDKFKAESEAKLEASKQTLEQWIAPGFNPNSPIQMGKLLKVLGCGNLGSADNKALNTAAASSAFNTRVISEIQAYRKQAKLISTYFVKEKFWNGRLYYKTNPAGTDSGRLASTESSFWCGLQIQNIPQGLAVKSWIKCDDDWDGIAEGDYAQSEARCVGYLSGCHALIELVESDKDYHTWNAHKFFGVAYADVTKALRDLSKRVNHGSNYNMGPAVLLDTMGPKKVAEARLLLRLPAQWTLTQVCSHLLLTYAKTYPEVKKDWYDSLTREIRLTKKLVSALGWTRHFFADPSTSKPALNAAVAHGPQNLSAGIINTVFYSIWRDTVYGDLRGKVRLKANIHDSILFAYRGADTPDIVRKRMECPVPVTDVKGVTRTMLIPPDMSTGKVAPVKYWAELK